MKQGDSFKNNRMNVWKRAMNSQRKLLRQRAKDDFRNLKRHSELKSGVKKMILIASKTQGLLAEVHLSVISRHFKWRIVRIAEGKDVWKLVPHSEVRITVWTLFVPFHIIIAVLCAILMLQYLLDLALVLVLCNLINDFQSWMQLYFLFQKHVTSHLQSKHLLKWVVVVLKLLTQPLLLFAYHHQWSTLLVVMLNFVCPFYEWYS